MKIAVDLDDTLSVVDRVTRASAYIARKKLPFHLKDENAHRLVDVFDWELGDVLTFIREGGDAVFTEAAARKGARETLARWQKEGHEIIILTARQKEWFQNPEKITRDWLEKRRIPYDRIAAGIPMEEKGEFCARSGISILIDDNVTSCVNAQECGVYAVLFYGKHNAAEKTKVHFGGAAWTGVEAAVRRILSVAYLEDLAARTRPVRQTDVYDGWELRFDNSFSAQGNYVRPVAPSAVAIQGKITLCEACYHAEKKRCRFRLTPLDVSLNRVLAARGYLEESRYDCMTLNNFPEGETAAREESVSIWRESCFAVTGERFVCPQESIRDRTSFLTLYEGNAPVAVGICVTERGAAGLYHIFVREGFRRKGYGAAMIAALLSAGKRAGAKRAFLSVKSDNASAIALYRAFGFRKAYEFVYLVSGLDVIP